MSHPPGEFWTPPPAPGRPGPPQPHPGQVYPPQPYPPQPYPPQPYPPQPYPPQPYPPQREPDRTPPESTPVGHSRRAVLQGSGIAIVAGAAGFLWYHEYGPTPTKKSTSRTTANGRQLAQLSQISPGGGLVLTDAKIVLTRSGDQVRAFSAVCTHQGCLVSGVSNGEISCPCHGSAFSATTGAVTNGPATRGLAEIPITVANGVITEK